MTSRLAQIAVERWADIDGYAVGHGMPELEDLPVGRFVNFVWWWITRNAEKEQDITDIKTKLWMPPLGEAGEGIWSAEAETDSFAEFKRSMET